MGDPEELRVRWNDKLVEIKDAQGNTIVLDALVITNIDVAVGSIMWLGRLKAWTGSSKKLMRVAYYNGTPDVRARYYKHVVGLNKYRETLPGSS